jgi:hypothetical protein
MPIERIKKIAMLDLRKVNLRSLAEAMEDHSPETELFALTTDELRRVEPVASARPSRRTHSFSGFDWERVWLQHSRP